MALGPDQTLWFTAEGASAIVISPFRRICRVGIALVVDTVIDDPRAGPPLAVLPLVSRLVDVGAAAGWRCWVCDETVDPEMSVNDPRGPSVDSLTAKTKGKAAPPVLATERLAHRGCNTKKGAVAPVVAWPQRLFVVDPAPIIGSVERLQRKGGQEIMARCPTRADGEEAAGWLVDRLSRLCPELAVSTEVRSGGGQFLLVLHA